MEAAAAKLLDFSQPIDVPLLDQVVTTAFDAGHPQVGGEDSTEVSVLALMTGAATSNGSRLSPARC